MKYPPYPRYKPSGVEWLGDVPEHWDVKRIKHVARIGSGEAPPEERSATGGDFPIFGANGIIGWCGSANSRESRLLVGRVGAIGAINMAPPGVWISDNALIVYHDPLRASISFLLAVMRTLDLKAEATTNAQPLITATQVKRQPLLLPPLAEQHAIADFLDRETTKIDTLLAKKRTLVERLKEKRTALISRMVTRGLPPDAARAAGLDPHPKFKPSGIEWLGDVPEHWEVKAILRLASAIQTGPFGSQLHESDYVDGGTPLLNPADIIGGQLVPDDQSAVDDTTASRLSRHRLRAGDIIMGRRGEIGRCGVVTINEEGWLCGAGALVIRLESGDPRYFVKVFGDRGFSKLLELNAVGTTMLNLNPVIVGRMLVPAPPVPEQCAIADFLDHETARIDQMVATIEAVIDRLQEYRTALITAAVTGKIDVRTLCDGSHNGNITA